MYFAQSISKALYIKMIPYIGRFPSIKNNSFVISSIFIAIYSCINSDLISTHADRVSQYQIYNAINTPLNQIWPFITGLTTWTPASDINQGIYFVELLAYLPALLARCFLEINEVFQFQRLIDIGVIIGAISLFADLVEQHLIFLENETHKIVLKVLIIGSFIFSPWTAYMLYKSTWFEPIFMLFLVAALSALCRSKLIVGSILLAISFVMHYQYAFFISLYFVICRFGVKVAAKGDRKRWTMPEVVSKKLNKNSQQLMWFGMGFAMFPLVELRKYISIKLMNLSIDKIDGSSAISRIGLDGNQHSGGLIGSLQFLGGYKWYYCILIHKSDYGSIFSMGNNALSAIVNCELILATLIVFSAAAIVGIFILYKEKYNYLVARNSWSVGLLIAMFAGMLLVFQQSYTVHIIGYSYVWAFIFSIGFSTFIYHNFFCKGRPWKIIGIIVCLSCWNSLIQGSFIVTKILETSSYF